MTRLFAALLLGVAAWAAPVEIDVFQSGQGGYHLTKQGHQLKDALAPLDIWAKRWAAK